MDDNEFNKFYDYFSETADKHELESVWSIYEINDINASFGYVKNLSYCNKTVSLNKHMTYLDLWIESEKLIFESNSPHHNFIEAFVKDKKDDLDFWLVTGS